MPVWTVAVTGAGATMPAAAAVDSRVTVATGTQPCRRTMDTRTGPGARARTRKVASLAQSPLGSPKTLASVSRTWTLSFA